MILSADQVKVAILEFLVMKGRWGAHHFPIDTLVNWMGRKNRTKRQESQGMLERIG
jgi:hypothetical protein